MSGKRTFVRMDICPTVLVNRQSDKCPFGQMSANRRYMGAGMVGVEIVTWPEPFGRLLVLLGSIFSLCLGTPLPGFMIAAMLGVLGVVGLLDMMSEAQQE